MPIPKSSFCYLVTSWTSFGRAKVGISFLHDLHVFLSTTFLLSPATSNPKTSFFPEVQSYATSNGYMCLEVSALTNEGMDDALQTIITGQQVSKPTPHNPFPIPLPPVSKGSFFLSRQCFTLYLTPTSDGYQLYLKDLEVRTFLTDSAMDVGVSLQYINANEKYSKVFNISFSMYLALVVLTLSHSSSLALFSPFQTRRSAILLRRVLMERKL